MAQQKSRGALRIYVRALREVREYWPHLGVILLAGLIATPLTLLNPLPLKIIADSVLGHDPIAWPINLVAGSGSALTAAIGLSLVLALVNVAYRFCEWLFREWVGERMVARFRGQMFERALTGTTTAEDAQTLNDTVFRIS